MVSGRAVDWAIGKLTLADAGRGPSREIFCKPRKGRCGRPAGAGRESARSLVSEKKIFFNE